MMIMSTIVSNSFECFKWGLQLFMLCKQLFYPLFQTHSLPLSSSLSWPLLHAAHYYRIQFTSCSISHHFDVHRCSSSSSHTSISAHPIYFSVWCYFCHSHFYKLEMRQELLMMKVERVEEETHISTSLTSLLSSPNIFLSSSSSWSSLAFHPLLYSWIGNSYRFGGSKIRESSKG